MSNILITGASGFLGKEIYEILNSKDNIVWTLGRSRVSINNLSFDITDTNIYIPNSKFQHIIHLAGKAHSYPKTPDEVKEFYDVNYQGTRNLLNALTDQKEIKSFTFASTVAVYGLEEGENISELQIVKPITPYGKSKLDAEKLILNWCLERKIECLILRLPLIVGNNPPGNLGAMKKAIKRGRYIRIQGNNSKKSAVLASDIGNLISNFEFKGGVYNLTDGCNPKFSEIEEALEKSQNKKIKINLPLHLLKKISKIGDLLEKANIKFPLNSSTIKKLTSSLTFNDDKARKELNWKPNSVIEYLANN